MTRAAAGLGFLAIVAQTLLLRDLVVAGTGDETTIGIGLAAWLVGITLGTRLPARPWRIPYVGLALWPTAGLLLLRAGRALLAPPPGELPGPGTITLLAAAAIGPGGALVGWTFARLAPERGVRPLYVAESLGAAAGGLAVTGALLFAAGQDAGPLPALPVPLALAAGAAGLLLAARGPRDAAALGGLALLLAAALAGPSLEARSNRLRFAGIAPGFPLAGFLETPWQHLDLAGDGAPWNLWTSGLYAGSFPDPDTDEPRAHELACLVPRPRRIIATGEIARGTLRFLLEHPVEHVEIVALDRPAFEYVTRRLAPADRAALADPRVHVTFGDLRREIGRGPWDLVLVLEPDPVTLFLARLATREFYARACASLAPDGVLVVRFESAPNVQDPDTASLGGSLSVALADACGKVLAAPAPHGLLVAGREATLDPEVLAARWRSRGIVSRRFVPETFALDWPPARVRGLGEILAAADAPPSTDDRPVAFLHALARRQRISGIPGLGAWLRGAALLLLAWGLAPRPRRAAVHRVAGAGALGMAGTLVVLYRYQAEVGALYGRLGLLTAAFMVGLAAGGALEARVPRLARWAPLLALAAFLLPIPHLLALLAGGILLGTVFPHGARLLAPAGAARAGAALEAADHLGAAAAAPLVSLALIPWIGARATLVLAALPALVAALVPARAAAPAGMGDRPDRRAGA